MHNNEPKIIDVAMGDMKAASNDRILRSNGIGSCVVITLYDSSKKVGAMAHSVLAESINKNTDNPLRFVDGAIDAMISALEKLGARKSRLEAKIVGGASMFKVFDKNPDSIGLKNIEAAKNNLEKEGIKIVATDTGENCGRSVTFELTSGLVEVKTKI
ncbi:MAG: chemotaxis protein CheD [Minisyncoccales bacterium]